MQDAKAGAGAAQLTLVGAAGWGHVGGGSEEEGGSRRTMRRPSSRISSGNTTGMCRQVIPEAGTPRRSAPRSNYVHLFGIYCICFRAVKKGTPPRAQWFENSWFYNFCIFFYLYFKIWIRFFVGKSYNPDMKHVFFYTTDTFSLAILTKKCVKFNKILIPNTTTCLTFRKITMNIFDLKHLKKKLISADSNCF